MLTLFLSEHFRYRDSSRGFADATLEIDETQDVSFLASKTFHPSLHYFAVPNRSALKLLKRFRKMVVTKSPIGDSLLRDLSDGCDFCDSDEIGLDHECILVSIQLQ